MQRIVVATDGSEHAERAVELAGDLAAKYGAELIAVHVVPDQPLSSAERHLAEIEFSDEVRKYPGSGFTAEIPGSRGPEMQDVVRAHESKDRVLRCIIGDMLLRQAERAARAKGVESVETVRAEGNAATRILETAKEHEADMIVLGSRGMGALGELFLGSVSHRVNHLSEVTVVTVK